MPKIQRPHSRLLRILKLIHDQGRVSRTELVEQTGYSAFLVSRMADELLNRGFVSETASGNSTGGRPPMLLSVNPDLGRLIGVHIGTVNVRVAVTDITGSVLAFKKAPSRVDSGPDAAIPHIIALVEETMRRAQVPEGTLRGMGVGISGVLDRRTGTTLFWPKVPQWVNVPVRQRFADHFGTLVEVEDSPRTMALAERKFGVGGRADHFVYVMVGAGTGSALFLNGQLYAGAGGFAGEFGHVAVDEGGALCSCGNRGCIEALVSASALIRQARSAVSQGLAIQLWQLCGGDPNRLSMELLAEAAEQGDHFCVNLLSDAGTYLGMGLLGLVNLLNPSLIVVGGGVATAAGQWLLPAAERVVRQRALAGPASQVEIARSTLEEEDWARGAALLVTGQALDSAFAGAFKPEVAMD